MGDKSGDYSGSFERSKDDEDCELDAYFRSHYESEHRANMGRIYSLKRKRRELRKNTPNTYLAFSNFKYKYRGASIIDFIDYMDGKVGPEYGDEVMSLSYLLDNIISSRHSLDIGDTVIENGIAGEVKLKHPVTDEIIGFFVC